MASVAELPTDLSARAVMAAILDRPATPERRMADAVRALAIDAVERAGSGRAGLPMGMADAATVLWTRFHGFDAADPHWPDRDRFVLSAGHGAMLLYALLHLTGHDGMAIADIKRFRQFQSPAAGHPESGEHAAIEATTGPLGQGLAAAVGMALAERLLAARFGRSLVDHRTWAIACDGDLTQGISHEAACLAGQLRLERLTVLWDDNAAAGSTADDPLRRFAASGWAVKRVDGHDAAQVAAALSMAMRSKKPTLIACRTAIGRAAPLGAAEAQAAKTALGWNHPPFEVPEGLAAQWRAAGTRGARRRRGWLKRLARHPQRAEFERVMGGTLPADFHETIAALRADFAGQRPHLATCAAGLRALEALMPAMPELIGGSAGVAEATMTQPRGMTGVVPGTCAGRYVPFGAREHGMAAAMNGMALHGGIIPYGGALLAFSDYMRPALRLAALMRLRVIHVLTHDSIGLGADGPTHQPVEQLAGLRAVPNLHVFRPADALETAECWELALRRADGPSLLVLSRQSLPALRGDGGENRCARGGYVLAEADGPRQATLLATGSEVSIALAARDLLNAEGITVAVASLPCWELFALQDAAWRSGVLGGAVRVGVEAASGFGWERWLGSEGAFIGLDRFGASAPGDDLYRELGITAEAVAASVRRKIAF